MSYIRCLSNPEGLYVYSDGKNVNLNWCGSPSTHASSPGIVRTFDNGGGMVVPHEVFETACRKWVSGFGAAVDHEGFRIEEVHVYDKTGEPVPQGADLKDFMADRRDNPSGYYVRLTYKKARVHLWAVTFQYMISRFTLDWHKKYWKKEQRKKQKST